MVAIILEKLSNVSDIGRGGGARKSTATTIPNNVPKIKAIRRRRMWGTINMVRAILFDKECWAQHLKLDPLTGLDPPNIRLRAAQGLDAADYFIQGYWIWGKIIENLAALGYDPKSMYLASYDWRLSIGNLEVRDAYFSRLKQTIELAKRVNSQEKVVVVAHSMGSVYFHYFLHWVQHKDGGNGGKHWVRDHIRSYVNIAGPLLGVPKALAAFISGEMRDTVLQQPIAEFILEKFFSRRERAELFRSWGGLASLLPKGGDDVWGDGNTGASDVRNFTETNAGGYILEFRQQTSNETLGVYPSSNLTVSEAIALFQNLTSKAVRGRIEQELSFGSGKHGVFDGHNSQSKHWSNPLEMKLPEAPDMEIYCLYGVGKT